MKAIISYNGKIAYGVNSYLVSTKDDLKNLEYTSAPGSTAYVEDISAQYFLTSDKRWTQIKAEENNTDPSEGGGSAGGDEEDKNLEPALKPYYNLYKIQDYLYNIEYETLDYNYAKSYFKDSSNDSGSFGACSAVRSGNFYGRNFDWIYNNQAEFVIKTVNQNGKFATLGVSGSLSALTNDFVESGEWDKAYYILPFMIVDGINECGVVVNANVVPIEEGYFNTTTVPTGTKQDEICALMLPRYILDNFATAREAALYIRNHVALYFPNNLRALGYEEHFMIADATETFILECINNEVKVINATTQAFPAITNFHIFANSNNGVGGFASYITGDESNNGHITTPYEMAHIDGLKTAAELGVTPHGSGLERYNLIVDTFGENKPKATLATMQELMNKLNYTNAYNTESLNDLDAENYGENFWWTEFVGIDNLTSSSNLDDYKARFEDGATIDYAFLNRDRDPSSDFYGTWQTTHSCIYDITNRALYLAVQEEGHSIMIRFIKFH